MELYDNPKNEKQLEYVINIISPELERRRKSLSRKQYYEILYSEIEEIKTDNNISALTQCDKQECSFCCYDKIYGSEDEIENLIDYVQENNIPYNQLFKQTEENYSTLKFGEKVCPLLKDRKCSVYEHRPIICRTHNVSLGEDVNKCKRENGETTGEYRMLLADAMFFADVSLSGGQKCLNFELNKL